MRSQKISKKICLKKPNKCLKKHIRIKKASDNKDIVSRKKFDSTQDKEYKDLTNNEFTIIDGLKDGNTHKEMKNCVKSIEMASLLIRARDSRIYSGLSLLKSHFRTNFNNFNELSQSVYWADKILINSKIECEIFNYLNESLFPTMEFMVDISKQNKEMDILCSLSSVNVALSSQMQTKHTLLSPLSSLLVPNPVVDQHGAFINAGTYIKRMCWAPLHPELHLDQYLAVAVYKELTDRCNVFENSKESGEIIQIYNCGQLLMGTREASLPSLEMVLTHNWGKVTDMSWSPQPLPAVSRSQKLIGHLALCCSDGFIRIIPIGKLNNPGALVTLNDNHPILCLGSTRSKEARNVFPTTMHWRDQFPDRILAGYNNGRVAAFILESCVFSTRAKFSDKNIYLKPSIIRRVFDGPCRSLQISPYNWRLVLCSSSNTPHSVIVDFDQPTERCFPSPVDIEPTVGCRLIWPYPGDMVVLASGKHFNNIPGLLLCAAQTPARRPRKLTLPEISSIDLCHLLNIIPIGTRSGELSIFSLNTNQVNHLLKVRPLRGKESRDGKMKSKFYFRYNLIDNEQIELTPMIKSEYPMPVSTCTCPPNLQCVHKLIAKYSISITDEPHVTPPDWQFDSMLNINEIASNPNPGSCTWVALSLECGLIHLVPLTHFYRSDLDEISTGSGCSMLNNAASQLIDDLLLSKNLVYIPKTGRPRKTQFSGKNSDVSSVSTDHIKLILDKRSDLTTNIDTTPMYKTRSSFITDYFHNSCSGKLQNSPITNTKLYKRIQSKIAKGNKSKSVCVTNDKKSMKKSIATTKKNGTTLFKNKPLNSSLVSPNKKLAIVSKENLVPHGHNISTKTLLEFSEQNSTLPIRTRLRSYDSNKDISDNSLSYYDLNSFNLPNHSLSSTPRKRLFSHESLNRDEIDGSLRTNESTCTESIPIRKRLRSYHSNNSNTESPVKVKSLSINRRVKRSRIISHNLSTVETSTGEETDRSNFITPVKTGKVKRCNYFNVESPSEESINERITRSRVISLNLSAMETSIGEETDRSDCINRVKAGKVNHRDLSNTEKPINVNNVSIDEQRITRSRPISHNLSAIETPNKEMDLSDSITPVKGGKVNHVSINERITRSRATGNSNEETDHSIYVTPIKIEKDKHSDNFNKENSVNVKEVSLNERVTRSRTSPIKVPECMVVISPIKAWSSKKFHQNDSPDMGSPVNLKDASISERVTRSKTLSDNLSVKEASTNEPAGSSACIRPVTAITPIKNNKNQIISKGNIQTNKKMVTSKSVISKANKIIAEGSSVKNVEKKSKKIDKDKPLKQLKRKNVRNSELESEKTIKKPRINAKKLESAFNTNPSVTSSHSPSFYNDHDSSDIEDAVSFKNLAAEISKFEKSKDKKIVNNVQKDVIGNINDKTNYLVSNSIRVEPIKPFKRILNTDIDCDDNEVELSMNNQSLPTVSSNVRISMNYCPANPPMEMHSEQNNTTTKLITSHDSNKSHLMVSNDKPDLSVNHNQSNDISRTQFNTIKHVPISQSTPIRHKIIHDRDTSIDHPVSTLVQPRSTIISKKTKAAKDPIVKKSKSKSDVVNQQKLDKLQNIFRIKRQELLDSQSVKIDTIETSSTSVIAPVKTNWFGVDNAEYKTSDADLDINRIDDISLGISSSSKKKPTSKSFVEDRMDKIKKVITRGLSQSVIDVNTVKDDFPELLQPFRPLKASKSVNCSQIYNT